MRRLRIAIAAIALSLAVPIGLLIHRAVESIRFERTMRHRAVTDRIFDELERALSEWLAREEGRPVDHYRFYMRRDEALRSPLSERPAEPFIVAYFQVDPDGGIRSPRVPRQEEMALATARGHWPPAPGTDTSLEERTLEGVVAPFWRRQAQLESSHEREAGTGAASSRVEGSDLLARSDVPTPGGGEREGALQPADGGSVRNDEKAPAPSKQRAKRPATAYEVLESFNLGARQRLERKQVVVEQETALSEEDAARDDSRQRGERVPRDANRSDEDRLLSSAVQAPTAPPEASAESRSSAVYGATADDVRPSRSGEAYSEPSPSAARPPSTRPRIDAFEDAEPIRIVRNPMAGERLDAERLLLYRTVLVGREGYRQGMVIDLTALGRWLETRVIAPSSLADAVRLEFGVTGPTPVAAAHGATHRFAAPFSALDARITLAPLAGVGSARTIYMLAAVLVVVALVGLFALYRMVAVALHFAQRRNNFVAAVSHELKTPLTAIRMHGEMLRDGLVPSAEKQQEYFSTITDESERLSRLIDNVLEFSRLERGARPFRFTVGQAEPVVREIVDTLRPQAAREGFVLEVECEAGLPAIRFDRDALFQMVFNLVDNAMKYASRAEDRRITIRLHRAAGGDVVLRVRDFGPGIARDQIGRVFEPFYRAGDEMTRSAKGSGIGLALVRDLARGMEAAVQGRNAEGGGFCVDIAFAAAGAETRP